jgi:cell wall-associated NlpC family hydrolase
MPDKLSYSEFASKIKAKYPQYESLDDNVLVKKIVDKYPQYNESVDTTGMANQPIIDPKEIAPASMDTSTDAIATPAPITTKIESTPQKPIDNSNYYPSNSLYRSTDEMDNSDPQPIIKEEPVRPLIKPNDKITTAVPVKGKALPMPNYIGVISTDTADSFADSVVGKSYKLGAKGVGNDSMYGKTKVTESDCSGAVIASLNKTNGLGLDPITTSASKLSTLTTVKNIPEDKSKDGDVIFFKTNGSSIDHVGRIVVDGNGNKFIADLSSTYNQGTITPFETRIENIKKDNPDLKYQIESFNKDRTIAQPIKSTLDADISHAQNLVSTAANQAQNNVLESAFQEGGALSPTSPMYPKIVDFKAKYAAAGDNTAMQQIAISDAQKTTMFSPEYLQKIANYVPTSAGITPEGGGNDTTLKKDGSTKTTSDALEFQARSFTKSVIGSATQFMALMQDPTAGARLAAPIVSKLTGQPASVTSALVATSPIGEWRQKQQESDIWLKNYNPNSLEDIAAFGVGVLVDLPIFSGFGKVGSTLWKAVPAAMEGARALSSATKILAGAGDAMSKKLLLSGVKGEAADWAVKNAIMNIGNQVGSTMLGSGTALAGHAATQNVLSQLEAGKSIGEINLEETIKSGKNPMLLGMAVGPMGLLSSQAGKYAASFTDKPLLQIALDKGIKLAGFESEVAAFTIGGKMLEGDKTPTTWQDFAKSNLMFGMMHKYGVGGLNENPLSRRPELAYDRYNSFSKTGVTLDELNASGYATKEELWKAVEERKFNLSDKNIPATLKVKIAYALDPNGEGTRNLITGFDLTDNAVTAEAKTENGISRIKTFDKDGNLLEVATSANPQEISDHLQTVLDAIRRKEAINFSNTQEGFFETTKELRKKGIGINLQGGWNKSPLERTDEETTYVESVLTAIGKAKKTVDKAKADREAEAKAKKDAEVAGQVATLEAQRDGKVAKTEDPIKADEIKTDFNSQIEILKANNSEDKEAALANAQTRLNLPKSPKVDLSEDTQGVLDKLKNNEPVINAALKEAADELYKNYKDLEIMKSSDLRKFTLEQIEKEQERLGNEISKFQDAQSVQANKEEFVNISDTEVKKVPENPEVPTENQTDISKPADLSSQKVEPNINNEQVLTSKTTENGKESTSQDASKGQGLQVENPTVEPQNIEAPVKLTKEEKRAAKLKEADDLLAKAASDIASLTGAKTSFTGEERARWGTVIKDVTRAISLKLGVKGRDLVDAVKNYFKDNKIEIPDDLIDESIKEYKDIQKEAKQRIKDERKQRMKLPSESPETKVTLSEMAGLKDQIRLESLSANKSGKSIKDQFKDLGAQIKDMIKNYNSKADVKKINPGQYRSIINRLSNASTDTKMEHLLDYVYNVLDGAEYKEAVWKAKNTLKVIKSYNLGKNAGFGTAKSMVEEILKINPKDLTVEELADFNAIISKIKTRDQKTPDLNAVIEAYFQVSHFDEGVIKIKEAKTYADLLTSMASLGEKVGEITSMSGYVKMSRALDRARVRLSELNDQGLLTTEELDSAIKLIGSKGEDIAGVSGKLEKELEDFKAAFSNKIVAERKGINVQDVKSVGDKARELIFTLLNAKKSDIEALDGVDMDSYMQFVKNLKVDGFTPESAMLLEKIKTKEILRKYMDSAAAVYEKSKKGNEWLKDKTEKQIYEYVRSLNPRELEVILGNLGKNDGLSRTFSDVGNSIIQSSRYKKEVEEKFLKEEKALFKGLGQGSVSSTQNKLRGFSGKTKYSKEREELNYMGMILAESSFRSSLKDPLSDLSILDHMFGENYTANFNKAKDKVEFADKKRTYDKLLSDAREIGATKTIDGKELLDVQRYQDHLKIVDPRRWNYIQGTRNVYQSMNGMAEVATMRNGRTYTDLGEDYFPLKEYKKSGFLQSDDLTHELNIGWTQPKMIAGATFARENRLYMIETNPSVVGKAHLDEMTRNYFVLPELRANSNAIKSAFGKVVTDKKTPMYTLGVAFQKGLVSRTAFVLNGRKREIYNTAEKTYDRLLAAKKKALIANPNRILAESASNLLRGAISAKDALGFYGEYNRHPVEYSSIMDDYFGDKHFSRWDQDANENFFTSKIPSALEHGAMNIITFSDTQVGRRVFSSLMAKEYYDRTGHKFDIKKYNSDPIFREQAREDVEHATSWGLRRTEELFNSKNPMSQPEMTRFFRHEYDPSSVIVKTIDGLQGFNRNEWSQFKIGWYRATRGGDPNTKGLSATQWMGIRDMVSIPVSNFLYMQTRLVTNVGVKYAVQSATLGSVDANTQKQAQQLGSLDAWVVNGIASIASLTMGGAQGLYHELFNATSLGLDAAGVKSDWIDYILGYANDELYMLRTPSRGQAKQIISSVLPGPSASMFHDAWSLVESGSAIWDALGKAYEGGYVSKEQYLKVGNGLNLMMIYSMPNPVSGWIQGQLSPVVNQSAGSSSGVGAGTGRLLLRQQGQQPMRLPASRGNSMSNRPRLRKN